MWGRVREVVIYFKFHENRSRGLGAVGGRKSPSPIDKAHGLCIEQLVLPYKSRDWRKAAVVLRTVAEGLRFDCCQYDSFTVFAVGIFAVSCGSVLELRKWKSGVNVRYTERTLNEVTSVRNYTHFCCTSAVRGDLFLER